MKSPDAADRDRRDTTLAFVTLLVVGAALIRTAIFVALDDLLRAGWFVVVGFSALGIRQVNQTLSLAFRGNLLIGLLMITAAMEVHYRGGIGSVVVVGMSVLPLLATLLLGWRTGLVWLCTAYAVINTAAAYESWMADLPDHVPAALQYRVDWVLSLLIPTMVFAIGAVYDWVKDASLLAIAQSEHSKVKAEQATTAIVADRMTTMGMLAAGVGHEINNPLTYVIGNLSILKQMLTEHVEPGEDRTTIEELIDDAREGAERIQRISSDLQTFARADRGEHEHQIFMAQVVESALALVQHELRHHATLVQELDRTATVWGNETGLVQIMVNLLVNAVKAVQEVERNGEIHVRLFVHDDRVTVEVRDNGPGVSPYHLKQIFDPFFTTRSRGTGTGLGLAISRSIAHDHNGTLEHHSDVTDGAVFLLTLPRHQQKEDVLSPSESTKTELPRMRILVIDDEPLICQVIEAMLLGHEVVTTNGGKQAQAVLQGPRRFHLILCDLMMPEMDGVALYEWICTAQPQHADRFVAMTGGASSTRAQEFAGADRVEILSKPIDKGQLERALAKHAHLVDPDGSPIADPPATREDAGA